MTQLRPHCHHIDREGGGDVTGLADVISLLY